jgi:hypothetical protein
MLTEDRGGFTMGWLFLFLIFGIKYLLYVLWKALPIIVIFGGVVFFEILSSKVGGSKTHVGEDNVKQDEDRATDKTNSN